jgi:hypothetical protein
MAVSKLITYSGQILVNCSDGSTETIQGTKLSSEQLLAESHLNSDKGTRLNIVMSLLVGEKAHKVQAKVEVTNATYSGHRQKYRLEFKFVDLSGDGREILERFINERSNAFGLGR